MSHQPLFENLIFIEDPAARSAAANMAADEALFLELGRPWLRVYGWSEPSVSIGCFEPWEPALVHAANRPLVRRWTGGGLVEHGSDWTWSVGIPQGEPFLTGHLRDGYRRLHACLLHVLLSMGCQGLEFSGPRASTAPGHHSSNACFSQPVLHDLMASHGGKIAGGAIRRTKSGLLYQGSVAWPAGVPRENAGILLAKTLGSHVRPCLGLPEEAEAQIPLLVKNRYGNEEWSKRIAL